MLMWHAQISQYLQQIWYIHLTLKSQLCRMQDFSYYSLGFSGLAPKIRKRTSWSIY